MTHDALPVAPPPTAGRLRVVMIALMLGVALAALDMTIVATAAKTIADDLGGLSLQAWATTSYLITSAITTPLYGKLSDLYGRKPLYLAAISLFVAGSIACAVAGSMYELAAYRAVQGLGAGGLFSLSMTIVSDVVPARYRARYTGHLIAVYAVAAVLGPVAGGFLADQGTLLGITGWRWVFLVNVPVGALALLVVARGLVLPHARRSGRVDWPGALALAVGLVPLLVVAEEGRSWGWTSVASLLCYAVGGVGLVAFLAAERSMGRDALLPLRFFGYPVFGAGSLAGFAVGFAMFGVITALPLYLQVVGGASPTGAGLLMLPLVAGVMVTSKLSGAVIARTGRYRIWPLTGSGLMIVGLLWLSGIGADTPFWTTAVCMAVFGIGLGGNLQPLALAVANALPARDAGVATASATFFRQLGGSIGSAVFLAVLFATAEGRIGAAFARAAGEPGFRAAASDPAVLADPVNRTLLEGLRGGVLDAGVLEDSSILGRLAPELARPFLVGFSDSANLAFALGAVVAVLALIGTLAMHDVPIREDSEAVPEPTAGGRP